MEPMIAHVPSDGQYPSTEQGDIVANSQLIGNIPSESSAVAPDSSTYGDSIAYIGNSNPISEGDGGDPKCNSEPAEGISANMSVIGHDHKTVESPCVVPAPHDSFNVDTNVPLSTDGAMGNGNSLSDSGAPSIQQPVDVSDVSSEEERLWSLVRSNCLDFNAWTALIHETEKEPNILKIRNVYDPFLAEFPLCYGYWKKYADHEGSLNTVDKVEEVYERAVSAVTYSVDIWVHYSQFKISTHGDPDNIRRIFERGLAYVGTDYLSAPLWDEYINYEFALQEWSNVMAIYTRILENPTQQLDRYFNSFKEYVVSRPLAELRTSVEPATLSAGTETTEQGMEGEVRPDDTEKSSFGSSTESSEAEELEKFMATREEMYKNAKEFDSKIIQFETSITRPYFHVKPLDEPELDNWHNFLDFFESGDDLNKVVKLYERCLIACANYPEFWIRYVSSMEASGSMELANNALARATQVFVKKQPDIHLFAARFKEHNGDIEGARAEYQFIYSECSSVLLEAIVKHANMEYRLGNKDAAFSIYEATISSEQSKEHTQILPSLFVQYSRFAFLVAGNAEKAREIITNAIGKVHISKFFIEAVIHLESLFPSPKKIDYLESLVEKFLLPSPDDSNVASTSCREEVSCIFLEFLDLFGDSQSIKKAENRHFKSFLHQRSTSVSRKRRSEDYLESDKIKFSKTHMGGDLSSNQSVMGAYPNTQQNPWPGGYGQNPPAWTQPPQVQGQQQWNSGYAPQDGYSGYGSYGSYAQPQVPASVPQTTTYGAYPVTSSAQAYPQQNYTQPAAAPSYATQATTPATQAYYSNYY